MNNAWYANVLTLHSKGLLLQLDRRYSATGVKFGDLEVIRVNKARH
jgi:hypothetical protein